MSADSEQMVKAAEEFADLLFGIRDLAVLLETSEEHLRVAIETKTPLGCAILRGWLRSESEYRAAVIKHAKQGSTAAQAITQTFINRLDK